jgi:hypothetical protein
MCLATIYPPPPHLAPDNGDYPSYRRFACEGTPRDDEQARFEFGLDCLLDGIAARLAINPDS